MGYTNSFTSGTTIRSADVNKNFTEAVRGVNRQNDTTNTAVLNQCSCYGWGAINTGAGGESGFGEAVTFPITFDSVAIGNTTGAGYTGTYAGRTQTGAGDPPNWLSRHYGCQTTGFTAVVENEAGGTAASDDALIYNWEFKSDSA